MNNFRTADQQNGAALVTGLVLLVVITVLAVSGMNTATTELAIARNNQNYGFAFQAAESGLEHVLGSGTFDTDTVAAVTRTLNAHDSVLTQIEYQGSTIIPDKAFSLGAGSGFAAYHFIGTATAQSLRDPNAVTDRDTHAVHRQSFYVIGPESHWPGPIEKHRIQEGIDGDVLPVSGASWSAPSIARMHIAGVSQNADQAVIVVGGGQDKTHDTASHLTNADGAGAGIYILDLETGAQLWRAAMDAGANLQLDTAGRAMDRAIASDVRVVDLNGDSLADRMYAVDIGGQVWRFDISNGQPAGQLAAGGVIAQLGADLATGTPAANQARRFFNAPDISLLTDELQQRRYIAISLGSGNRTRPVGSNAADRFYSIRDPDVFNPLRQSDYDTYSIIREADLVEVSGKNHTIITANDNGWRLTLPPNETVLSDSLTFDDQIFFVSFTPDSDAAATAASDKGTNFLYRLRASNGDPVIAGPGAPDPASADAERRRTLQQRGIAPRPAIIFPGPEADCAGSDCSAAPLGCVGMECFDPGFDAFPVRTLWSQAGIE